MSNICDFCGSSDYEEVYRPIATKRNSRVCICNHCGLVFSIHDDIPYSREPNPSGDADWGNVRFCKGQRLDSLRAEIPTDATCVLDVGSSRGDFVTWYQQQNPHARITALEPDTRIATCPVGVGFIGKRLEDANLPADQYDFVYCNQTLEHVDHAAAFLREIWRVMAPGGKLLLEVPNIECIDYPLNIEEFFIDKHNYHFTRGTLLRYLCAAKFFVVRVNEDKLNVRVLATKDDNGWAPHYNPYAGTLIATYAHNIQRNRAKLPAVVEQINRLNRNMKVAFFGANTIMDLMVKYGGLDPSTVGCLVDDYLNKYLPNGIHGIPVQPSEALRLYQPDVCVVLARFMADAVVKRAQSYGIRNIVKFADLLQAA